MGWSIRRVLLCAALVVGAEARAGAQESRIASARAAVKVAPNDAEAALALGRTLRRAGRDVEAADVLKRASTLAQGKSPDLTIRVRWELARAAVGRREFSQAVVQCRLVLAQPGGEGPGRACAAEAHLLWRRATEALAETERALKGGKRNVEARVAEGLARELELREAEAEAAFREALAWRADGVEAHVALGRLLVRTGKREEGITLLRKAVALDPDGPEPAYELGRALAPSSEGLTHLRRAANERPTFVAAWLELARLELDSGHADEAQRAAEAALQADAKEHGAHLALARALLAKNLPDEAMKAANAALAILANSAAAKLIVADSWARKGEIDLAMEAYQAAFGLDRQDPTPLVRASQECLRLARPTSARAFALKATKEFPQHAPAHEAHGDALVQDKDTAAARAAYERAASLGDAAVTARVQGKLAALAARR